MPTPPRAPRMPRTTSAGLLSNSKTSHPFSSRAIRTARSRYCGSMYFTQVSAGSSTCPSASTTGPSCSLGMRILLQEPSVSAAVGNEQGLLGCHHAVGIEMRQDVFPDALDGLHDIGMRDAPGLF